MYYKKYLKYKLKYNKIKIGGNGLVTMHSVNYDTIAEFIIFLYKTFSNFYIYINREINKEKEIIDITIDDNFNQTLLNDKSAFKQYIIEDKLTYLRTFLFFFKKIDKKLYFSNFCICYIRDNPYNIDHNMTDLQSIISYKTLTLTNIEVTSEKKMITDFKYEEFDMFKLILDRNCPTCPNFESLQEIINNL